MRASQVHAYTSNMHSSSWHGTDSRRTRIRSWGLAEGKPLRECHSIVCNINFQVLLRPFTLSIDSRSLRERRRIGSHRMRFSHVRLCPESRSHSGSALATRLARLLSRSYDISNRKRKCRRRGLPYVSFLFMEPAQRQQQPHNYPKRTHRLPDRSRRCQSTGCLH